MINKAKKRPLESLRLVDIRERRVRIRDTQSIRIKTAGYVSSEPAKEARPAALSGNERRCDNYGDLDRLA